MPEFTEVDVQPGGRIVASAWNGQTGGIIAFYASVRVTISGELTVDGMGFRGGVTSQNNGTQGVTVEDTTGGAGGGKGEGLDGRSWLLEGRGSMANGAGGGNAHNAGGGGAGNGGPGGGGSMQNPVQGNEPNTFGRAGGAINLAPSQILSLGAGGGAGQQNNSLGGDGGATDAGAWMAGRPFPFCAIWSSTDFLASFQRKSIRWRSSLGLLRALSLTSDSKAQRKPSLEY